MELGVLSNRVFTVVGVLEVKVSQDAVLVRGRPHVSNLTLPTLETSELDTLRHVSRMQWKVGGRVWEVFFLIQFREVSVSFDFEARCALSL